MCWNKDFFHKSRSLARQIYRQSTVKCIYRKKLNTLPGKPNVINTNWKKKAFSLCLALAKMAVTDMNPLSIGEINHHFPLKTCLPVCLSASISVYSCFQNPHRIFQRIHISKYYRYYFRHLSSHYWKWPMVCALSFDIS